MYANLRNATKDPEINTMMLQNNSMSVWNTGKQLNKKLENELNEKRANELTQEYEKKSHALYFSYIHEMYMIGYGARVFYNPTMQKATNLSFVIEDDKSKNNKADITYGEYRQKQVNEDIETSSNKRKSYKDSRCGDNRYDSRGRGRGRGGDRGGRGRGRGRGSYGNSSPRNKYNHSGNDSKSQVKSGWSDEESTEKFNAKNEVKATSIQSTNEDWDDVNEAPQPQSKKMKTNTLQHSKTQKIPITSTQENDWDDSEPLISETTIEKKQFLPKAELDDWD